MARRPAYNTHAERARRAEARESLLAEVAAAGDLAEEVVPAISAWIQVVRRETEYAAMFGRAYERHGPTGETLEDQMRQVRDHVDIGWEYGYAARAAHRLGALLDERASDALLTASRNARAAHPWSDEEIAKVEALYPKA